MECCRTIIDVDTPFHHPDVDEGGRTVLQVTDPAHPLYGRQFEIVSAAHGRDGRSDGHVFVRYRDGIVLRLPRAATDLMSSGRDAPLDRLCRSAVQDLLALVKEYESCPKPCPKPRPKIRNSPHARSGPRLRPKTGKKSSRN